jgi:glycosyltransferase involved in cell wall biosynthesis
MNILLLSNHLNIGGISSYLLSLTSGLLRRGHKIYVASSGGELEKRFIKSGSDLIYIPLKTKCEVNPKIIFSFFKLDHLLKQKNINIIHANTRVTSVLAYILSRKWGVPYISTSHGFFKTRLSRRIFPLWGKKVIAISEQVKEHLVSDFKLDREAVRLVYNGVDLKNEVVAKQDRLIAKQKLGLKDSAVVGIIARLSDVKGHKYLIEAMGEVLKVMPDVQLLIVGDGREKDNLINLSRRLGISESIIFISSVEDSSGVLEAIDLFVMPSVQEGLGLSIMEAMAKGIAVVASDVGGIRNLIKDGFNARLVRPRDIKGLARVIIELLQDREKLKHYAANGQRTIKEDFSLEKMITKTEGVYAECINAGL